MMGLFSNPSRDQMYLFGTLISCYFGDSETLWRFSFTPFSSVTWRVGGAELLIELDNRTGRLPLGSMTYFDILLFTGCE